MCIRDRSDEGERLTETEASSGGEATPRRCGASLQSQALYGAHEGPSSTLLCGPPTRSPSGG
eukprot:14508725-Alexandrium_andersonii.AAC.1